jgi:altronate dehydratase small subunit
VATLLADAEPGEVTLVGETNLPSVPLAERVALGHKVALRPIAAGQPVVKYGVTIGLATEDLALGRWIHTHNCRSQFDERSSTLDRHSGAPTDTRYE